MVSSIHSTLLTLAVVVGLPIDAFGQRTGSPAPTAISVDSLAWLGGCWASARGESGSGEMWTIPSGGTLLGVSRTVRGGRTVAHEFMMIREDAGSAIFIAQPSGQAESAFRLVSLGEREAVFENPEHDFPQRVIYRSADSSRLMGRIEGMMNGEFRGIDFPLVRTECP